MIIAATKGHVDVVKLLIKAKADLNKASKKGTTPLKSAAAKDHHEIVNMLTKAGAR